MRWMNEGRARAGMDSEDALSMFCRRRGRHRCGGKHRQTNGAGSEKECAESNARGDRGQEWRKERRSAKASIRAP